MLASERACRRNLTVPSDDATRLCSMDRPLRTPRARSCSRHSFGICDRHFLHVTPVHRCCTCCRVPKFAVMPFINALMQPLTSFEAIPYFPLHSVILTPEVK